jgi:uncharacterized protein (DUF433 family)
MRSHFASGIQARYTESMEPALEKRHIEITPGTCGGKPRIAGHRIRVQDIVLWTEEGQSPDEIAADFPQLELADIYAALAYYHDHRAQIDADIREDEEYFERMRAESPSRIHSRSNDSQGNGGHPVSS